MLFIPEDLVHHACPWVSAHIAEVIGHCVTCLLSLSFLVLLLEVPLLGRGEMQPG